MPEFADQAPSKRLPAVNELQKPIAVSLKKTGIKKKEKELYP
ncbi:hypothetical protein [Pseudomonas brassicacearum]|nr:hypothetical protein [Pseudomonas brassicacearum]